MYCPQCRAELPDDAKYCIKCSYDFTRITTPSSKKQSQDTLDGMGTSFGGEVEDDSFGVGSLFANRYEILSEGVKGGMGVVVKCTDTKLNKIVALKIIHPRLLTSKNGLSRFRQEVSISQELQHPKIVRVFNLEEWEGKEYFAMEWVEGMTLREIIKKRQAEKKTFSLEETQTIISQLCDALQYAHQYTIHRDIKPENILVSDDKGLMIKLTDFGIAKMLNPSQFTSTSMQMGTPYYMAPEQKTDATSVDKRADIYALGVVLFELLTLENTIGLKLPSQINSNIPKAIDGVLVKALELKPKDRYENAKDLADTLNAIITKEATEAERKQIEEADRKREAEERLREEELKRQEAERQKAAEEAERRKEDARRQEERTRQEEERKARGKEDAERLRIEDLKKREEEQRRLLEQAETQKNIEREKSVSANRNKAIIAVVIVVIIVAIFSFQKKSDVTPQSAPAPAPPHAPISSQATLIVIDPIVVNLSDSGKYVKLIMELELIDASLSSVVAGNKPKLKDAIIELISRTSYESLSSVEGKRRLKEEIIQKANMTIGRKIIKNVYFTDFVLQ